MNLNVYKGARRIALGIGVLWVIGSILYPILNAQHVHLFYSIAWPEERAVRTTRCNSEDGSEYISRRSEKGKMISVTLCFTAQTAQNGQMLVPFAVSRIDPNTNVWDKGPVVNSAEAGTMGKQVTCTAVAPNYLLNQKYSRDVTKYTRSVAAKFTLPLEGQQEADRLYWDAQLSQLEESVYVLLAGIFVGPGPLLSDLRETASL